MKKVTRSVSVLVAYFPGTNCEEETMAAFKLAGAKNVKLAFIDDLRSGKIKATDCDIFCFCGGFSYGDNISTGIIAAIKSRDIVAQLKESRIPVGGICNGFQEMARLGMFGTSVTLAQNICHTFRSWPVLHRVERSNCIWTGGLEGKTLAFPSAHGYGRVVYVDQQPNIVLTYASESPNGGDIAGICSDDGLDFGLMDHPERPYGNPDGLKIFRNIILAVG